AGRASCPARRPAGGTGRVPCGRRTTRFATWRWWARFHGWGRRPRHPAARGRRGAGRRRTAVVPGRRRQKRTERSKLDATPPWETRFREEPEATTGPYDERDAPDDELQRIDLGALRVPVNDGYDVRLDLN